MKGGYRPGAGRPRGSKNGVRKPIPSRAKYKPVETAATIPAPSPGNPLQPTKYISGIEWLRLVVNDPTADVSRRDRAAGLLAGIEARKSVALGKKEQAEQAAEWAGWGTSWWNLLHKEDHSPKYPPPDDVQEKMRNAEMESRGAIGAVQKDAPETPAHREPEVPPKSFSGTPPSWDELLGPRLPKETPPSESDDSAWDNDLRFDRK